MQNALQCFDAVGWAAGRASRGTGMVIGLERDADLRMPQLMPLPLTVSCFSKIQIGFTFPVLAHPGSPGKRAVKQVCVSVCKIESVGSFALSLTLSLYHAAINE